MKLNTRAAHAPGLTHEGAPAAHLTVLQKLRRSVLACFLWEKGFYESGEDVAERILRLAADVPFDEVGNLALEARGKFNLRHVPLLLLCALARHPGRKSGLTGPYLDDYVDGVIQRADEMAELIVLYRHLNKRKPREAVKLPAAFKRGLAMALGRFDAYALGKYKGERDEVKLRDVIRLVHPKPANPNQEALWKSVLDGTLPAPDTWEVALSGGADKRTAFTRLLMEEKLGYLALLRNLRNMADAGVDEDLVRAAIVARKNGAHRVLPFRYTAAARAAPRFEPFLDQALSEAVAKSPVLPGKTIILVDVSGSMDEKLSAKSDLTRMDAAATLASIIHGDRRVFTFSTQVVEVPPRYGMAGVDAIKKSQPHGGTYLGAAVRQANVLPHDRLIVVTDEQSHDAVPEPKAKRAYMINVASNKNGVGYGAWNRIDGFSEAVLDYIREYEASDA